MLLPLPSSNPPCLQHSVPPLQYTMMPTTVKRYQTHKTRYGGIRGESCAKAITKPPLMTRIHNGGRVVERKEKKRYCEIKSSIEQERNSLTKKRRHQQCNKEYWSRVFQSFVQLAHTKKSMQLAPSCKGEGESEKKKGQRQFHASRHRHQPTVGEYGRRI